MRQLTNITALGVLVVAALASGEAQAQAVGGVDARVVAKNIPGASAIAQVGTFVPPGGNLTPCDPNTNTCPCANPSPIRTKFPGSVVPGAILGRNRLLVGSASNFGAPLAAGGGRPGSLLSIDPSGSATLVVPADFDRNGGQAVALSGAVQMFSANSPNWLNSVNNPNAVTAQAPFQDYAGVGNPLGLSNNNGFGRIWPANAPFGLGRKGSSSILDPTGLPLKGAPNAKIGGVYVGDLTNRNVVTNPAQPQVIPGALKTGGVGTALLGPSPDGTCKAVFAVVTADGAVVQEHTLKGLDGVAPRGTVRPILGGDGDAQQEGGEPRFRMITNRDDNQGDEDRKAVEPRFGVIMNPYTNPSSNVVRQLFVSEPFYNTIAVLDLVVVGSAPNQVLGLGSVRRIGSWALNLPVDLAPVKRDRDTANWASNTTLDDGSDFYVANAGDNTIVRMRQDGGVVAIRHVMVKGRSLDHFRLNGLAASADATDTTDPSTIFATFIDPRSGDGGVLAMPAF
jgi:hypothetical protein